MSLSLVLLYISDTLYVKLYQDSGDRNRISLCNIGSFKQPNVAVRPRKFTLHIVAMKDSRHI